MPQVTRDFGLASEARSGVGTGHMISTEHLPTIRVGTTAQVGWWLDGIAAALQAIKGAVQDTAKVVINDVRAELASRRKSENSAVFKWIGRAGLLLGIAGTLYTLGCALFQLIPHVLSHFHL
jgi:hypothetical protein